MTKVIGYNIYSPFKTINLTTPQLTSSSFSEVKLGSIGVSASTFGIDDVLKIEVAIKKTGINSTSNYRILWNSADSITSPTPLQIGTYSAAANFTQIFLSRRISINTVSGSGNGTQVHLNTDGVLQDHIRSGSYAASTLAINWAADGYIIIAGRVNNVSDSINCQWMRITNG